MTQPQRTRIRSMSRLGAVSLLSLCLVVAASVTPATASPGATPKGSAGGSYVALGDSFTSGQGAAPWLTSGEGAATYIDESCFQSRSGSYPTITAHRSSYREALNFACSGATTADVLGDQLDAIDASVKLKASLVTLTVGGIDAGSNQVLAVCLYTPPLCGKALSDAQANLPTVLGNLVVTYTAVAAAFPNARIVVLNYPLLFDPSVPSPLFPTELMVAVNGATDALNGVIAGAVFQTKNPRVSLTDVTQEFTGHGIGSEKPYITFNGLSDPASFHPNVLGNTAGYVAALRTDGVLRGR